MKFANLIGHRLELGLNLTVSKVTVRVGEYGWSLTLLAIVSAY